MEKTIDWQTHKKQLQRLAALDFNYDEKMYHASKDKSGWHLDRYGASLGFDAPGEPLSDGGFAAAKRTLQMYQFPDPRLISAVFDPEAPLVGRNMLMFAHFAGFTFNFGVRVTSVVDELRTAADAAALRVWGYSYRTLKGHFEIGEIRFEISKNLQTGEITFDVNAYSKPDRIPNFFFRTGFRVFGRTLQKYFAKSSIARLRKIVAAHTKPAGAERPGPGSGRPRR